MRPVFACVPLLLLLGCSCGASSAAWPPALPGDVPLEEGEPRFVTVRLDSFARHEAQEHTSGADPSTPPAGPQTEAGDGDLVEVVQHDYQGIQCLEMVFGEAAPDEALPSIWVLHGRGGRAQVPGGPFWGLPRAVRIFVPQGPLALGDGYAWFRGRVAEGRTDELSEQLRDAAGRLAQMIEAFAEARPTLGRPIVTGFSQGGHLAYALALLHPERVSEALPNAGWFPPQMLPDLSDPSRFPRIRAQHTVDDDRVPYEPTQRLVERLREAGLDAELVRVESGGHVMTEEMSERFRGWLLEAIEAASVAAVAESESETGAEAGAESESETGAEAGAESETRSGAESETRSGAESGAE